MPQPPAYVAYQSESFAQEASRNPSRLAEPAFERCGTELPPADVSSLKLGNFRLSFDILQLVLKDITDQISDKRLLSEPDVLNMQKLLGDFQLLAAGAVNAPSCDVQKSVDSAEGNNVKSVEENGQPCGQSNGQAEAIKENGQPSGFASEEDPASPNGRSEGTNGSDPTDQQRLGYSEERLVDLFRQLDRDGSGTLSTDELRKALVRVGVPPARVMKLFRVADKDNSGEIDVEEWIDAVCNSGSPELPQVVAKMAFRISCSSSGHLYGEIETARCVVYPGNRLRVAWDIVLGFFCIYIATMLPYIGAFRDDLPKSTTFALDIIDRSINYFFLADIIINFRTAYAKDNGDFVTSSKGIAINYLRGWFLLDLVSSFPFDDIASGKGLNNMQAVKLAKITKLARVVRFLKTVHIDPADISDGFDDFMQTRWVQQIARRGSVFVKALLLCHWLACGLKLCDQGILSGYVPNTSVSTQYLAAMYWSIMTLTTVGYGDMIPSKESDSERAYIVFVMVICGGFYGYIVGTITSMVSNEDLNMTAYHDRMEQIQAWLDHHKMPILRQRIVRRYFQAYFKEKSALSESEVWNDLSPELQKQIGQYIIHENVIANPLFDGMAQGLVVKMQSILRRVTFMPGDVITHGDEEGMAMYIIISGTAERDSGTSSGIMGAGESFGEEVVLEISSTYEYTVTALSKMVVEMLLEDEFRTVFAAMPAVIEKMRANAFELHGPDWGERLKSAAMENQALKECIGGLAREGGLL